MRGLNIISAKVDVKETLLYSAVKEIENVVTSPLVNNESTVVVEENVAEE